MIIDSFRGPYNFLSNFHIEPDGTCVEVEYQAFKGETISEIAHVFASYEDYSPRPTPAHESKHRGRAVTLFASRPLWDTVAAQVMGFLVFKKFYDHAELRAALLETGDAELVEGNTWGDTTWGKVKRGGNWVGKNYLGMILMDVRDVLR